MSAFEITALIKAQRKLWSGDIIGLQVDGLGLLAAPYFNGEPIPEFNESVSHLRISSGKKFSTADYRRCMFRVENDVGLVRVISFLMNCHARKTDLYPHYPIISFTRFSFLNPYTLSLPSWRTSLQKSPIVFGSVVRLSHYPSHLLLSAGAGIEDLEYEEPLTLRGVQLLSADSLNSDDLAHKWIIYPRYQLRDEGDPINRNDYVTIRNVKYKDLHLTSFVVRDFEVNGGSTLFHALTFFVFCLPFGCCN